MMDYKAQSKIEDGMLVAIIVLSSFMLYWSFNYSEDVAYFPRLMAIIVIITGIIILVYNHIDFDIGEASGIDMTKLVEEDIEEVQDGDHKKSETEGSSPTLSQDELILITLVIGYAFSGFLVGLLWTTPIFIVLYSYWRDLNNIITIIFLMMSILLIILFMEYLYLDMTSGYLFEGI